MKTYSEMNVQIVGILRQSDNPASLYAAERIVELEAERDALLEVLGMIIYQYDKGHFGRPLVEAIEQAGEIAGNTIRRAALCESF